MEFNDLVRSASADLGVKAPERTAAGARYVIDGDTFVEPDGTHVRLRGADTPETPKATPEGAVFGQPGAELAADMSREFLNRPGVHLEKTGGTTHGRAVGRYVDGEGHDLSQSLIARGAARPDRWSNQADLGAEARARLRELGIARQYDDPKALAAFDKTTAARREPALQTFDPYRGNVAVTGRDSAFSDSVARGVDSLEASFYAVADAAGELTGVHPLERFGAAGVRRNLAQAAQNPAHISHFDDIHSLADFGTYVVEALGENVPTLASLAVGAGAGRLALAGIGKAALERLGASMSEEAAGTLAKQAAQRAGLYSTAYAQGAGDAQMQLQEGGIDAPGTALLAGIPVAIANAGALDSIVAHAFKGASDQAAKGLIRQVAEGFGIGAGATLSAGAATELVNFAARAYHDPSFRVFSAENLDRLKEAGIKGALVGGLTGGVLHAVGAHAPGEAPKDDALGQGELDLRGGHAETPDESPDESPVGPDPNQAAFDLRGGYAQPGLDLQGLALQSEPHQPGLDLQGGEGEAPERAPEQQGLGLPDSPDPRQQRLDFARGQTVPESLATVQAGVDAIGRGRRLAAYTQDPSVVPHLRLPGDHQIIPTADGGALITSKENAPAVRALEAAGKRHQALGYPEEKPAEGTTIVQARDAQDRTVADIAADARDPEALGRTAAEAQAQAGEGGRVETKDAETALAEREAERAADETAPEPEPQPEPEQQTGTYRPSELDFQIKREFERLGLAGERATSEEAHDEQQGAVDALSRADEAPASEAFSIIEPDRIIHSSAKATGIHAPDETLPPDAGWQPRKETGEPSDSFNMHLARLREQHPESTFARQRLASGRDVIVEEVPPRQVRGEVDGSPLAVRRQLAKLTADGTKTQQKRLFLTGPDGKEVRANAHEIVKLGFALEGAGQATHDTVFRVRNAFLYALGYLRQKGYRLDDEKNRMLGRHTAGIPDSLPIFQPRRTKAGSAPLTWGELRSASDQLDGLVRGADAAHRELSDTRKRVDKIQAKLDTVRGRIKEIQGADYTDSGTPANKRTLLRELANIDSRLQSLRDRYADARKGDSPSVEQLDGLKARAAGIEAEAGKLRGAASRAMGRLKRRNPNRRELVALRSDAGELYQSLRKTRRKLDTLTAEHDRLQKYVESTGLDLTDGRDDFTDRVQTSDSRQVGHVTGEDQVSHTQRTVRVHAGEVPEAKQARQAQAKAQSKPRQPNELELPDDTHLHPKPVPRADTGRQVTVHGSTIKVKHGRLVEGILQHLGIKTKLILTDEGGLAQAHKAAQTRLANNELDLGKARAEKKPKKVLAALAAESEALRSDIQALKEAEAFDRMGHIIYRDSHERGADRVPIVVISSKAKGELARIKVLAHEMGHLVQRAVFDEAPESVKAQMRAALGGADGEFAENFANQMYRWAMTRKAPRTLLDKFFHSLGQRLRKLYNYLTKRYPVHKSFAEFMDALVGLRMQRAGEKGPETVYGRRLQAELSSLVGGPFLPYRNGAPAAHGFTPEAVKAKYSGAQARFAATRRGKATLAFADKLKGGLRGMALPITSADAELRAMGPLGERFANHFHTRSGTGRAETPIKQEIRRRGGPFYHAMHKLIETLPQTRRGLLDVVKQKDVAPALALTRRLTQALVGHTPAEELDAEIAPHVKAVRDYLETLHTFFTQEMGQALGKINNYFPLVVDVGKWISNRSKVLDLLGQHMSEEEALQTYKNLSTSNGVLLNLDLGEQADVLAPAFRFKNRRLWKPELVDALQDYFVRDIPSVLSYYTDAMVRRAVMQKRFGLTSYQRAELKKEYQAYGASVNDPLARLNYGLNKAHRTGRLTDTQYRRIKEKILPAYLGRLGAGTSPKLRQAISYAMVYQNARLLGLATLSSLVDVGQIAYRGGFKQTGQAMLTLLTDSHARGELYDQARLLGTIRDGVTDSILNDALSTQFSAPSARKWSNVFFRMIGMEHWTHLTRVMALEVGRSFLRGHADTALGLRKGDQALSARRLDELGVSPQEVKAWESDEMPMFSHDGAHSNIQDALHQFIDQGVLRPDAQTRAVWMSDPKLALFAHLKSFMFAYHEQVLRRVWELAKREPDLVAKAMPMILLATATLPLAALGYETRRLLNGDVLAGRKEPTGGLYLFELLNRSGMLGVYQTLADADRSANTGKNLITGVAGPTVDQFWEFMNKDFGTFLSQSIPVVAQSPSLRHYVVHKL